MLWNCYISVPIAERFCLERKLTESLVVMHAVGAGEKYNCTMVLKMNYDSLCDDLMQLSDKMVAAIVEHWHGYKVSQRIRKEFVKIEEDKVLFALLRCALLPEKAKDYLNELGELHYSILEFDNLLLFIVPLKDELTLILLVEPGMMHLKTFINDVKEVIERNQIGMQIVQSNPETNYGFSST